MLHQFTCVNSIVLAQLLWIFRERAMFTYLYNSGLVHIGNNTFGQVTWEVSTVFLFNSNCSA